LLLHIHGFGLRISRSVLLFNPATYFACDNIEGSLALLHPPIIAQDKRARTLGGPLCCDSDRRGREAERRTSFASGVVLQLRLEPRDVYCKRPTAFWSKHMTLARSACWHRLLRPASFVLDAASAANMHLYSVLPRDVEARSLPGNRSLHSTVQISNHDPLRHRSFVMPTGC
jgi:hypothetical protein